MAPAGAPEFSKIPGRFPCGKRSTREWARRGGLPLDAAPAASYNPAHDTVPGDHHSNYRPGALTQTSGRDKGVWETAPPLLNPEISRR